MLKSNAVLITAEVRRKQGQRQRRRVREHKGRKHAKVVYSRRCAAEALCVRAGGRAWAERKVCTMQGAGAGIVYKCSRYSYHGIPSDALQARELLASTVFVLFMFTA